MQQIACPTARRGKPPPYVGCDHFYEKHAVQLNSYGRTSKEMFFYEKRTVLYSDSCVLLLCACGNEVPAREVFIDYGESTLYSQEDMDAAIRLIEDIFAGDGWKGCELHSIRYTGDTCNSQKNIRWMNDLAKARNADINYTQCMEFVSDFHSPKSEKDQGVWNLDEEYTDWQWWLARTDGGDWQLITWGY